MAFRNAAAAAPAADINITPLVDVLLVLLVIFMIAAPVLEGRIELPIADSRKQSEPPPVLQLDIDASGQTRLDGQVLAPELVQGLLAMEAQRQPQPLLEIRSDADTPYAELTAALAAAERAGLQRIAIGNP